jgi:hypothetical protein
MDDFTAAVSTIAAGFTIEDCEVTADRQLARRITDGPARQRLITFYRKKYPYLDLSDLVEMIIDDYDRDRR